MHTQDHFPRELTATNIDELKEIFPCYEKHSPIVFTKGPYDVSYKDTMFFRSAPKVDKENYTTWLNKVEKKKGDFWKNLGIFDLIQLSRHGPRYQKHMFLATLHFWNALTSSLHLKCAMLTPTMLDVAAITRLKTTGEIFNPDNTSSNFHFDFKRPAFGNYIKDHHNTDSEEVTDKKHVAFLTFWLSIYVFCTRYFQVAKKFRTLAIQLHEGR